MKVKQSGAVLVMVAILIVALIAVAALALDIGRLLVLRTEMQNAVDAAALAAAAELDDQPGAQARAMDAAKSLLVHDSRFAKTRELLGTDLSANDISFKFFCAIENNLDPMPENITAECPEGGPISDGSIDDQKYISHVDANTHYVRVTLNPTVNEGADEPRYSIDLYFLPVLRAIGINTPLEASTTATAVAGRSFLTCNYPPLMICNPNETAVNQSINLTVGQQIRLYMGATNGSWVPGDFGLLVPPGDKSGAADIGEYLASEGASCSEPLISTAPGGKVQQVKWGLNTRFGIYGHKYNQKDNPPAPNVLDYPRDSNLISDPSARIGNGAWQPAGGYWPAYHPATITDPGLTTRYDYYLSEITSGLPAYQTTPPSTECNPVTTDKDCPSGSVIWNGNPDTTDVGSANRRVITVPVLNCTEMNIKGSTPDIWVAKEEYWRKFFITEHVDDPSGNPVIYGEYLGRVSEGEGTLRVVVKLYE